MKFSLKKNEKNFVNPLNKKVPVFLKYLNERILFFSKG